MSNLRYYIVAILSVQLLQHREVTELRWNGATELIRVEVPEKER